VIDIAFMDVMNVVFPKAL